MSQILTTPPAVEPVSLADAKAHLRITHGNDDAYLSTLIAAARRQIENRTGLRLLQQGWSVFLDAWPSDGIIHLPLYPVISVDDIISYGELDTPATLDAAHYFLDASANPPRLVFRQGRDPSPPGRRARGIEIRLTVGFGATAASVPQELKQALLIIMAHWFANRGDGDAASLPAAALDLLAPFRTLRLT